MSINLIPEAIGGLGVAAWRVLPIVRDWSSRRRDHEDQVASRARVRRILEERFENGEPISDAVVDELLGLTTIEDCREGAREPPERK